MCSNWYSISFKDSIISIENPGGAYRVVIEQLVQIWILQLFMWNSIFFMSFRYFSCIHKRTWSQTENSLVLKSIEFHVYCPNGMFSPNCCLFQSINMITIVYSKSIQANLSMSTSNAFYPYDDDVNSVQKNYSFINRASTKELELLNQSQTKHKIRWALTKELFACQTHLKKLLKLKKEWPK